MYTQCLSCMLFPKETPGFSSSIVGWTLTTQDEALSFSWQDTAYSLSALIQFCNYWKCCFYFPFALLLLVHMGKKEKKKSSHTCTATHGESESKRESVSRTCKFLSVCDPAAAVGVMQPAINISEDLHAKEQNVHVSLYCIKPLCVTASVPPPHPD